jgi:hypothetical protein
MSKGDLATALAPASGISTTSPSLIRSSTAFSRGDATSLLFGFDAQGKITGIAVGGLAGD